MRKTFIIAACSLMLLACGSNKKNDTENRECTGRQSHERAKGSAKLTADEFRNKVADISKPEWKFLGDKPAVIDFYADWCGPCRMIAPTVEKVAQKYGDKIDVYKVNIDDAPELAQAFGISSIPTIMFVPMKGEPSKGVGVLTMAGFERNIEKMLEYPKN